jgi:hypothetical protein
MCVGSLLGLIKGRLWLDNQPCYWQGNPFLSEYLRKEPIKKLFNFHKNQKKI